MHPPPPLSEVAAAINDDIFLTELPSPYVSAPAFSCRSKSAAPRKVKFSIQNSWDATGGEVASQEVAAQPPKLRSWTRLRLERSHRRMAILEVIGLLQSPFTRLSKVH